MLLIYSRVHGRDPTNAVTCVDAYDKKVLATFKRAQVWNHLPFKMLLLNIVLIARLT